MSTENNTERGCLPRILQRFARKDIPRIPLDEQFPSEVYSVVASTHTEDLLFPTFKELLREAKKQGYTVSEHVHGVLSFTKNKE
jgi:hypothetical protein